jgi:IS5 family transposase
MFWFDRTKRSSCGVAPGCRARPPQIALWDAALPPELTQLSPELARLDEILDDDRFLAPYRRRVQ